MRIRNFILKFILFSILLSSTYFFALWQVAQGQIDYFYNKFTHQAGSLIIGISRSNDGIVPSVIEQNFGNNEIAHPVLNFAFAHQISDYGPIYLEAIQKKILPDTKHGLFILEVNPGALSILTSQSDSCKTLHKDQTLLATINQFNQDPNFEYLRKFYNHSLYKGFQRNRRIDKMRYTHPDGWQEVMMKNEFYEYTEEDVSEWRNSKLKTFESMMEYFKPSKARLNYLENTICYLQDFGGVYLVRTPISNDFLELEQSFWPEFDSVLEEIASKHQVAYFDYSKEGDLYYTYDGSHLFGHSAKAFTQQLCNDMKSFQTVTDN